MMLPMSMPIWTASSVVCMQAFLGRPVIMRFLLPCLGEATACWATIDLNFANTLMAKAAISSSALLWVFLFPSFSNSMSLSNPLWSISSVLSVSLSSFSFTCFSLSFSFPFFPFFFLVFFSSIIIPKGEFIADKKEDSLDSLVEEVATWASEDGESETAAISEWNNLRPGRPTSPDPIPSTSDPERVRRITEGSSSPSGAHSYHSLSILSTRSLRSDSEAVIFRGGSFLSPTFLTPGIPPITRYDEPVIRTWYYSIRRQQKKKWWWKGKTMGLPFSRMRKRKERCLPLAISRLAFGLLLLGRLLIPRRDELL